MREGMAKYIELIDKYRIEQSGDTDYNPPSYIWTDNVGQIARCEYCKHWQNEHICQYYSRFGTIETTYDDYCSKGKRKADDQT